MANKNTFSKFVALIAIFGPSALLLLGFVYGILSPREWAFGMLVWFAALLLLAIVRKQMARKTVSSSAEPVVVLDDSARRGILRGIWRNKVWIGVLAVCLPIGIVNGVAHRAWLPTLAGVGINLLLIYVAIREIRRRRTLLDSPRQ
ncbi:MAG TPA: hypothetical protein VN881_11785 [Candidatus Acidoferrales bacterium]|nr:hypothetical protein [Candidatus Acidoferrales bacterium]